MKVNHGAIWVYGRIVNAFNNYENMSIMFVQKKY